jgi:hypothetical protein
VLELETWLQSSMFNYEVQSTKFKVQSPKTEEAGDPRNRLPQSQLVSPFVRVGASEAREYMPDFRF